MSGSKAWFGPVSHHDAAAGQWRDRKPRKREGPDWLAVPAKAVTEAHSAQMPTKSLADVRIPAGPAGRDGHAPSRLGHQPHPQDVMIAAAPHHRRTSLMLTLLSIVLLAALAIVA
jgi:hypothetical protein